MMLDATRWRAFAGALTVCSLLAWARTSSGQIDDIGIGARVVLRNGVVPQAEDGTRVDVSKARRLFRVDRTQNGWLWIVSERVSGWVRPADLVPIGRAMEYLTEEILSEPKSAWAYVLRGVLWEEMKEPDIALAEYNEALQIDPDDAEAHLRRGNLRKERKHDLKRALADYDEAIRLDPKVAAAYHERGQALLAVGRYDDAVKDFTEAVKLDPKDVGSVHGRGIAHQLKGDLGRAIDDYNAAILLAPDDPVAHLNRGNAWCDQQDYDKAVADYTEAIRLDKHYVLAYNNRGIVWRLKSEFDKAVSDHNVAVRLAPKDHTGYLLRGIAWKQLKEYDRALADYNGAIELEPRCAESLNGRAWILATCPDANIRNGRISYDSAVRACSLTSWRAAHQLDTLAAAYAESRDFAHAAEWEGKALEMAQSEREKADFRARLQLYQEKKAYRDVPDVNVATIQPAPAETHSPAMATASTR
ncbi:MAG: tetratricopeptide repeat protein [Isosphaeraceae bacterium]|nr:tetratricopeptide repeat protein [Isosphaeraceae bacterium]